MEILSLFLLVLNLESSQLNDREIIRDKLHKQVACWNAGNIDCFMEDYWHHDSLMYIGKHSITYGWQNTMDNYRQKYPTKKEMGELSFQIIKLEQLDQQHIFVVGRWHLSRSSNDIEGHFSLLWEKIYGDWVIIADHSS